ncbi:DUF4064 domain-containing protein [Sporosarcina sp. NPDC096371]|uniref:DUF4064 domain-containing protein n=1 Tax=Sporosarcina sp. NPDC096371 TaxID=3364530 RepID=UPI0037FC8C1F
MKRTAEKSLSIIGAVLSTVGIIMGIIMTSLFNLVKSDPMFQVELEQEMLLMDPSLRPEDLEIFTTIVNLFGGIMWFIIIGMIIGLVLTIIGLVNIWNSKNPKLAGIMFIIAGVLSGFITLPSILLYIAGILCFTRKPPLTDKPHFTDDQYDGTMRPL